MDSTRPRTARHYFRVWKGRNPFQRQAKALVGLAFAERPVWTRDDLTEFCYERWTAPVVPEHRRGLKTVMSAMEQDRCVAWVVDYLLDPKNEIRFLARQRELGRRGARSRWGQALDPRVLLLPELAGLRQAEIADRLGCSVRTVKRKKRELGSDAVLGAGEAADLRKHLALIPVMRAANKAERAERRRAWLRQKARYVWRWKTRGERYRKANEHRFLVLMGWQGLTGFTGEVRVLRT